MTNLAMAIMSECSLFFVFTTVLFTQFPQAAYHIVYFATSGCCMYMPTFILHFCTVRVYVFVIVFLCLFFLSRYVCIHCDVFHFFLCDKNEKHSAHMGFFFFVSYKFLVPFKEGKKCPWISPFRYPIISCDWFLVDSADDSYDCDKRTLITNDRTMACLHGMLYGNGKSKCAHQMLNLQDGLQDGSCQAFYCCRTFCFIYFNSEKYTTWK